MARQSTWTDRAFGRRGLLVAGGGAAAFLAACGGGGDGGTRQEGGALEVGSKTGAATAGQGQQAKPGGAFRTTIFQQDNHRSPYHPASGLVDVLPFTVYDRLFSLRLRGPETRINLAVESVELPDPTTYVFKLRAATFHDAAPANGRAVSADDVKADVDYVLADKTASNRQILEDYMTKLETPDARTIRFATKSPTAYFFEGVNRSVVPRELLAADLKNANPLGSGPWRFISHTAGSFIDVERNPTYREQGRPYLDRHRVTLIPDRTAAETAFRSGQLDGWVPPNAQIYKRVTADMGNDVAGRVEWEPYGAGLTLNVFRKPFDDARVRQGITLGLDRKRILDITEFGEGVLGGPVGPAHEVAMLPAREVEPYLKHDLAQAKQLLSAAAFDFAKTYEFLIRSDQADHAAQAPVVKEQLLALGIKANIVDVSQAEFQKRQSEPGQFDFMLAYIGNTIRSLIREQHSKSGTVRDSFALNDPEIDAMVDRSETIIDDAERYDYLREIQRKLLAKWTNLIPLFFQKRYIILRSYAADWDEYASTWFQPQVWLNR